ncbi:MAG: hypothetical protein QM802_22425 [Agriterribacter sp.]
MIQIWDIIPKITSPLAVICFGFYVFYLFKKSDDKKREKSLLVSDAEAQRSAVTKILSDYPDITIDPIKDSAGALDIAKQIINTKLRKYNRTTTTLLIFSGIFALTFLLSLLIRKSNELLGITKVIDNKAGLNVSWAQNEASKNSKPYALLSVIQHIKLRDILLADSSRKRVAEFRDYYTLSAIKDILSTDNVFEEQFLTNAAEIKEWPGSETQEIESIHDGRFWVKMNLKQKEVRTIVTGANYIYNIPLPSDNSTSCFGDIIGSTREWMTCYPNSIDYIDNLTIIVESEGIDINLPPIATYRKNLNGSITQGEGSCKIYSKNNRCTLVAKWEKISPGECAGFKINWSLP